MHEFIQAHFQALQDAVEATAISTEQKQVNAGRIRRLKNVYTQLAQTHENRFVQEIEGLVRLVLKELQGCAKAQMLEAPFRDKLVGLHEELGLPLVNLKPLPLRHTATPKSKKRQPSPGRKAS